MLKTIIEKISKFAALYPQAMMYGISLGATLGIALAASFAISPHDALASGGACSSGSGGKH
ncbi:MAG TPA: hypothetical protein VH796_16500 [Nitrososphaeraceae archaeon]|jgi:uncharacterized membrane protein